MPSLYAFSARAAVVPPISSRHRRICFDCIGLPEGDFTLSLLSSSAANAPASSRGSPHSMSLATMAATVPRTTSNETSFGRPGPFFGLLKKSGGLPPCPRSRSDLARLARGRDRKFHLHEPVCVQE